MKKALVYIFVAVLLGTITMLTPFALFPAEKSVTGMDVTPKRLSPFTQESMRKAPVEIEKAYGITQASYPTDIFSILAILTLSFVVALAVKRYFTRKAFV